MRRQKPTLWQPDEGEGYQDDKQKDWGRKNDIPPHKKILCEIDLVIPMSKTIEKGREKGNKSHHEDT